MAGKREELKRPGRIRDIVLAQQQSGSSVRPESRYNEQSLCASLEVSYVGPAEGDYESSKMSDWGRGKTAYKNKSFYYGSLNGEIDRRTAYHHAAQYEGY